MYSLYRAWLSLGPCNSLPPLPPLASGSLAPPPLNLGPQPPLNGAPDVSLQVGPNMIHFSAHRNVLSAHSGYFKAALSNQSAPGAPIIVPNINIDEFSSLLTFMYTGYLDLNLSNIYNILLATHILHMPKALEICRNFLLQTQPMEQRAPNIIKPIPSRKTMLPYQQIYTPMFSNLNKSEETPFKSIKQPCGSNQPVASTSKTSEDSSKTKATDSCQTSAVNKRETTHVKAKRDIHKKSSKKLSTAVLDKVVVDIACCDGPVRFYRVVNKNYGLTSNLLDSAPREEVDKTQVMNKVLSESIRDKQIGDENAQAGNSGELFTCLYCNHTFKSQYCYQKHARRHLNPVSLDAKPKVEGTRREVRLLDMNVQYYPCKTCGSKFPSYYFVHKHRKMCHAEEMADSNNKNNEISAVNSQNINVNTQNSSSTAQNNTAVTGKNENVTTPAVSVAQETATSDLTSTNAAYQPVSSEHIPYSQENYNFKSIGDGARVNSELTNHGINDIMKKQFTSSDLPLSNNEEKDVKVETNKYTQEDSEDSSAIDVEIEVTS